MSKKTAMLLSFVALWIALWVALTLTQNQDLTVKMIVVGVICGLFGVSQKIIKDRFK